MQAKILNALLMIESAYISGYSCSYYLKSPNMTKTTGGP